MNGYEPNPRLWCGKLLDYPRSTVSVSAPPSREDCKMLDAIMKAAKQIHEEFDCLSDHVQTKKQVREQIASIIWHHVDRRQR
jgi:hypothetical protein